MSRAMTPAVPMRSAAMQPGGAVHRHAADGRGERRRAGREEGADGAGQDVAAAGRGERRRRDRGREQLAAGLGDDGVGSLQDDDLVPAERRVRRGRRPGGVVIGDPAPAAAVRRANSPGCGVSTSGARIVCHQRSPPASALSPSASTTAGTAERRDQAADAAQRRRLAAEAGTDDDSVVRRGLGRHPPPAARGDEAGSLLVQGHPGQLGNRRRPAAPPPTRRWRRGRRRRPRASRRAPPGARHPGKSIEPATTSSRPKVPLWARSGRGGSWRATQRWVIDRGVHGHRGRSLVAPVRDGHRDRHASLVRDRDGRPRRGRAPRASRGRSSVEVDLRGARAVRQDLDLPPAHAANAEPEDLADRPPWPPTDRRCARTLRPQ